MQTGLAAPSDAGPLHSAAATAPALRRDIKPGDVKSKTHNVMSCLHNGVF